ncbi:hypothetical protein [Flavobacterium haoranii]|uniref:Uncharacterized protein n=2 Tax=Flavobacterium haoranii TaxID=683124 RepID=A0A1M6HFA0_9FLAO|nr:hypothetical protein [Flavobacterium haoranii]SHJ20862.1 hypothetical protein SAMN05444337_1529 [Flavobacterium haoranii]
MKYFRPYYKFRFAKANIYKLAITFFLILFTSISSFGQTKEIRYYDGKYTQETALKKFYEFLKVYKDDKLQYNGKLEGNTIKANWKNTLLGSGYVVSNVQYTFYSDRIEIYLLLSTYYKDETNVIMLRPKSVDQQIVKLYKFEEDTHIHDVLAFMNIDKNITKETTSSPKTTTQTKSTTSEQTTETRYYNGRYDYTNGLSSKEVVLHKIKSYIDIKSKAGASFLKLEEKPDFLSGTWTVKSAQGNIVLGLDYEIGDKSLTIKLKYLTVGSQAISKKHPKEELRNLYNVAIENFILDLFKYLEIKNNTTSKQTTPATGSNANSQYVADANSFSEAFKKGKSEGQQQLYSLMKAQRNLNKNDAQIATYFYQLYHYLYPKDVKMSFELVYLLPLTELTAAAPITKIVKSLMTKEEYQTFANQAYDRLYNDK